LLIMNI